jgi:predicted nucleic acid-binding protein
MSILVDTNLLSRIAAPLDPQNPIAAESVKRLLLAGEKLCIVPQVIYEFWVVATRPIVNNGLEMSTSQAKAQIDELRLVLDLLPDTADILPEWQRLVVDFDCKGKPSHDARLVAAMNVHKVKQLLTFNSRDFTRYTGISTLDPNVIAK